MSGKLQLCVSSSCRGEKMGMLTLLLLMSLVNKQLATTTPEKCLSGRPVASGDADLSVVSGQNATGHWLAKVRLEHAAGEAADGASLQPLSMQLHRSARRRTDGIQTVALEATLSGLPSGEAAASCFCPPSAGEPQSQPQSSQRRVPLGYEHHPGLGYYRLHLAPVTWFEAKATCEREGAHLAVINSQEEATMVGNFFKKYPIPKGQHGIRIGLHDLLKEGNFYTVFGQPLGETGFAVWQSGEPNNLGGNEHCGAVFATGTLNDASCEMKATFICELP